MQQGCRAVISRIVRVELVELAGLAECRHLLGVWLLGGGGVVGEWVTPIALWGEAKRRS